MGDITWTMGKGPCLLGASLAVGWLVRRWRPSSHTRSPSRYLGVSLCLTHDFCALIISSWARHLASLNWSNLSATLLRFGHGHFLISLSLTSHLLIRAGSSFLRYCVITTSLRRHSLLDSPTPHSSCTRMTSSYVMRRHPASWVCPVQTSL